MKALWKDTELEFKSPLESDLIVLSQTSSILHSQSCKCQSYMLYSLQQAYSKPTEQGSGLTFSYINNKLIINK